MNTQDTHNAIYERLGKLEEGVRFLVDDAKKKNGYINDLYTRLVANEKLVIEFKNALETTYQFQREQRDERKKRDSLRGKFFYDWKLFAATTATGAIMGICITKSMPFIMFLISIISPK